MEKDIEKGRGKKNLFSSLGGGVSSGSFLKVFWVPDCVGGEMEMSVEMKEWE